MLILPHKLRRATLCGFAAFLAAVQPLSAQQLAPPMPRYRVNLAPTALSLGGTSAAWLATQVWRERLPHATCYPCDATRLPGVDRAILGPVRRGASTVSDVALGLSLAGAGALVASRSGSSEERVADLAVFVQTLSATVAITAWTKVAFHRPRPIRYAAGGGGPAPLDSDDGLSFPSGHASLAFAAAAAYASIRSRHGDGGGRTATALLLSAAATTAALRVAARQHFPTDVLAGAALGGAVGWMVPAIYPLR